MSDEPLPQAPLVGGDFGMFVTRLSFQGLLACGVLENPLTQTKQVNLPGASLVLEDLRMLHDKTRGNLEDEESEHLERVIRDLTTVMQKLTEAAE